MKVAYPVSHVFDELDSSSLSLKIARHSPCSICRDCTGLHPPPKVDVVGDGHSDSGLPDLGQYGSDDDDEEVSGYLDACACGHGVKEHNANEVTLGKSEFTRRGRVAIRLDEFLQDSGRLLDFDYTDEDILSLRKQMGHPVSSVTVANSSGAPNSSPSQKHSSSAHSPASSVLSDVPAHQAKKRRASSSSLSDAEGKSSDDEEDKPLASRIMRGARPMHGKRTGKQPPGKKAKQSNRSDLNGHVNGINGHDSKIKLEDKMDEGQLNGLTAGVPMDTIGRSSAGPPVRTEKPSAVELRKGLIRIVPVENDMQPRSLILLTGLKTLFQKQLPKMPREYIARLVYDEASKCLAIVKRGLKVVGGICYRPFPHRGFAEIVFFATNSADQEKGYGGMLMDHFKAHIRKAYPDMWHFLTYADNFAVGYFEKQGFSKDIALDRSVWAGYIKDYEGGTIMQCTMLDKVDYLDKAATFKIQQEAIMTKIRQLSKSHVIHQGLPQFQPGAPVDMKVDPKEVPGLRETGWTYELAASMAHVTGGGAIKTRMKNIMAKLMEEPRGWPFHQPVKPSEAENYEEIIKKPMDFGTISEKIENQQYRTFDAFVEDVQLVFDNCRLYNPEGTIFHKNAKHLDGMFKKLLAKHGHS
ncbi:hypothetical protein CPB83DRAFT_927116 [Crepidotus variabilis]|uniref:Histone acetyltransferase n=1 Tax=Crepidotus variabilis TaxID=179855 RepID=A0A9P6EHX7_9AGAR|nr:hypothetical protein CPB83DRAFT_927116 [Crepidotus variabilis]